MQEHNEEPPSKADEIYNKIIKEQNRDDYK